MPTLAETHRRVLEQWRGAMNLVGPGPIAPHFADSEAALAGLDPVGRWVDLGSGAGFPGLVLAAMYPSVAVDLVDSRKKRCVFLSAVVGEAEVGARVRVRCERVEDLPSGEYDGIVSRAFADPEAVLTHAERLLRPGGTVVLFLQDDARTPVRVGWAVLRERRYTIEGRRRRAVDLRWSPPA